MFTKILLTITVVAVVWCGFKFLGRLAELKHRAAAKPDVPPQRQAVEAEVLVECRVCGTWQSAHAAKSCGRTDCPY